MSVATHLAVSPAEYDRRIRALIPWYEESITEAAAALRHAQRPIRLVVDLGIGTGALTRACLRVEPHAGVLGIDEDDAMTAIARRRLVPVRQSVTFASGDFTTIGLPQCDAIVASYALHHIRSAQTKAAFYRRCFRCLRPRGVLISADCFPPASRRAWAADRDRWVMFLADEFGSRRAAQKVFDSWASEDTYMRLDAETAMLRRSGFQVDVPWRRSPMAVIAAVKHRAS